ncbi:hypothetical protein AN391_03960 [Pseudoalteromonas sp. P1-13-1a]|uniref:hypothetical protein n=1 Tax=Pseudoalteromonas sp. P1-13-1a TaxID=1723756 RepID=UPI0006D65B90|nr:hypothetical protein [Pseudoalteromonas sp. P1-13-1a]KPZ51625.1 hypothetical protein AN391_03960 [Pseudoalteromonas sp. P1-13-1a]
MKKKLLFIFLSISLILFSDISASKSFPMNKIGCAIINENYFEDAPKVLKSVSVNLSTALNDDKLIYKNGKVTVNASAATVIQTGVQNPWISSFKITISQTKKDTISVRSAPRTNDNNKMNVYFALTSQSRGELIISCSARE